VHLVAVRAQDNQIRLVIVLPVAVYVSDFKYRRNTETTMCAKWFIDVEGNFSVIDFFRHRFSFAPTSEARHAAGAALSAPTGSAIVSHRSMFRVCSEHRA